MTTTNDTLLGAIKDLGTDFKDLGREVRDVITDVECQKVEQNVTNARIKKIEQCVNGNGKPGLKDRVVVLEVNGGANVANINARATILKALIGLACSGLGFAIAHFMM